MTPTAIISAAAADGVTVALSAVGTIKAAGHRTAIDKWLPALREHKPAIIELLKARIDPSLPSSQRVKGSPWDQEDWRAFFSERAAIVEFDGGYSRAEAEAQAFACCIAQWLNRNPVHSEPGRCLACGEHHRDAAVLPFGADGRGHAWLHQRCSENWRKGRQAEAVAALTKIGVIFPATGTVCAGSKASH